MTVKAWELKNAIIDTVEVYLRDNAGYYALNHASAAEFNELQTMLEEWLTKIGVKVE